jgi:hypothetical protein
MNRERGIIKRKVAQLIRKYQNGPHHNEYPWRPEYPLGELYSWLLDRDKKDSIEHFSLNIAIHDKVKIKHNLFNSAGIWYGEVSGILENGIYEITIDANILYLQRDEFELNKNSSCTKRTKVSGASLTRGGRCLNEKR